MDTLLIALLVLGTIHVYMFILQVILKRTRKEQEAKNDEFIKQQLEEKTEQMVKQITVELDNKFNLNGERLNSFKSEFDHLGRAVIQSMDKNQSNIEKVIEQSVNINNSQKEMLKLSDQIGTLQGILSDKKQRGIFGESQLYSIFEKAFGSSGDSYEKQFKLKNGLIADSVIFGPESLGNICVDSKFPLENYNKANDNTKTQAEKDAALKLFKQDVKFKINDIASKYIIPGETANFAFMFIPAESVYNEIIAECQELVDLSYQKHVYLTSPTNLMAYLFTIESLWLEIKRTENIIELQTEFAKLSEEFARFEARREALNKDFDKVAADMKQLNTTGSKIQKRFTEIANFATKTNEE